MQPQMMQQMPDASQMQEQTPMSHQSPEFSHHHLRQMAAAPQFQQMQPQSQAVQFANQFQMAPLTTHQQMPFQQLQEMPQRLWFEQPSNDQVGQSLPMQQSVDQFSNPHHFVGMQNPMMQQFAPEDNRQFY